MIRTYPKVGVLISTCNGEKYIRQLLHSVCSQIYPDIKIFIRDDGSLDNTPDIVSNYQTEFETEIRSGSNLGPMQSYMDLLSRACPQVEYIAFCDQDDIWKPDKVGRAVSKLQQHSPRGLPALYFSSYAPVDADLNSIHPPFTIKRETGFSNALVQNIVKGCTSVINREAGKLILSNLPDSRKIVMHDWWIYLVISSLGRVIYDPEITMMYRRHSLNTMDGEDRLLTFWKNRLRRYLFEDHLSFIHLQVKEFLNRFGDRISPSDRNLATEFLQSEESLLGSIRYAVKGSARHQSLLDNIAFRTYQVLRHRRRK